ncbi:hypothetical protein JD844_007067 [Phrynosoma platyrhinos]|uniref:SAM domain-containing protein n=1 Tax=Phrynosoma platyrhinos TaxID=52577 RepID=A0ABQ7T321_PHRPL|nr:hypothetical protein JD844_007067 [Phrynosoma platyrhinos]
MQYKIICIFCSVMGVQSLYPVFRESLFSISLAMLEAPTFGEALKKMMQLEPKENKNGNYMLGQMTFTAPSFDDKILEVVAVFGSMQMAVSRVINLQHHRIAQCRTVKIAILGDEGVPVQVDGEAWIQPPGYIWIVHKNRAQTLTRDRAFENTLKSWEDKQKCELARPPSFSLHPEIISEEESIHINHFCRAAGALIHSIREIAQSYQDLEQELAHAVNASSKSMDKVYAKSKSTEGLNCNLVVEMVNNVKALHSETELLLAGKMALQLDPPQKEQLLAALTETDLHMRKLADIPWIWQLMEPSDEENQMLEYSKRSRSGKFRLVTKFKKDKNNKNKETRSSLGLPVVLTFFFLPFLWAVGIQHTPAFPSLTVHLWGTEEVAAWLEHLSLCEYKDIFIRHDVRGSELLHLERRDLKSNTCDLAYLGPRSDQSGPHEENITWDQGTEQEYSCQRGLTSVFRACIYHSP